MGTVLVIGAGPSGLVAAKELIECGLEPFVLEKNDAVGGLWKPEKGSTWSSLKTNLSKETCVFSDFPCQKEMYEYFCRYANQFSLEQYIHFNSEVKNLEKVDNRWHVRWLENGKEKKAVFDRVIIATGVFSKPSRPDIKGIGSFSGDIIHSHGYKEPSFFKDKKVLVVGNAFSGSDIAAEVATCAEKVTHAFRRNYWIVPRYFEDGIPLDYPFFKLGEGPPPQFSSEERFKKVNQWYSSISEQNLVSDKLKIEDFSTPPFIAISDTYLDQVGAGQIELKKATIDVIESSNVRFSDESEGNFDAIIFATGYETDLSYLDPKVLEDVHYQSENRFKPLILNECTFGEDSSLAWIGMERGPYLGIQELQARLVAQIFKGTIPFYSSSEIQIGLNLQLAIRDQTPQPQFPQNYIRLAEILGERLGVKPDYEKIKNENPHLHELLIEGLYTCARFRLTGPKAKTALESIRNANLR